MLPAALVLAIMILPTISALSRLALINVPQRLRDGAVGLGATRWETILKIVVPSAATGIIGSIILAFGRALGETMALAMLVGSRNEISWSILAPADTLAALLANSFPEADQLEKSALLYAALVLLAITLVVNILGSLVVWRASAGLKGLR
jgi:phosphate transport system permease protein